MKELGQTEMTPKEAELILTGKLSVARDDTTGGWKPATDAASRSRRGPSASRSSRTNFLGASRTVSDGSIAAPGSPSPSQPQIQASPSPNTAQPALNTLPPPQGQRGNQQSPGPHVRKGPNPQKLLKDLQTMKKELDEKKNYIVRYPPPFFLQLSFFSLLSTRKVLQSVKFVYSFTQPPSFPSSALSPCISYSIGVVQPSIYSF